MIKCDSCGVELSEESVFCSKCGNKLEQLDQDITQQEELIETTETETNIQMDILESKLDNKNRNRIILAVSIVVICIMSYIVYSQIQKNYEKHVSMAEFLVSIDDYAGAFEEIENLNAKKKDKELFEKIKMIDYTEIDFKIAEMYLESGYSESDYERALNYLLGGLERSYINEDRAKTLGIEQKILVYRIQFLDKLLVYFNLNEDEALTLAKLDSEEKMEKIKEIAPKGEVASLRVQDEKEEQERIDANPIEIIDTEGKRKGDYVYVTGAVKNISQTTHSYIKVKVLHFDESGDVIDTDWTYASSEALRPGEQKYFEIMTKYREGMGKFRVDLIDYN